MHAHFIKKLTEDEGTELWMKYCSYFSDIAVSVYSNIAVVLLTMFVCSSNDDTEDGVDNDLDAKCVSLVGTLPLQPLDDLDKNNRMGTHSFIHSHTYPLTDSFIN